MGSQSDKDDMPKPLMPPELADIIALHREMFAGYSMSATPPEPTVTPPPAPDTAVLATPPIAQPPADPGYPSDTPIAQMTDAQQAAYWRTRSRQHEERWKSVIDKQLTPEQVLEMQTKIDDHNRQALTDQERAVADAREAGKREAQASNALALVAAEFRVALHGQRTPDEVRSIIEPLDLSKFLSPQGEVDTAKVATYAAGIAPAPNQQWPDMGQGNRGPSQPAKGIAAGADLFDSRRTKR